MTHDPSRIPTEQELHALVDGQLAPQRAAEVERSVSADSELARRVAEWRQINRQLRTELDHMLDEPVPPRLTGFASARSEARDSPSAAPGAHRRDRAWSRWRSAFGGWAVAASLVIGLALGAAVGWFGRAESIERSGLPIDFAGQAALIHATYAREQRHPVEVWAAEEQHLVAWLSKRLGEPLKAPNLADFGFKLVGGRLVAGHRQPAAMFMYETEDGQRITLTVRRDVDDAGETAFRYAVEGRVGVFYWIDRDCGYAITGEVDRTRLLALARAVYGQLASTPRR